MALSSRRKHFLAAVLMALAGVAIFPAAGPPSVSEGAPAVNPGARREKMRDSEGLVNRRLNWFFSSRRQGAGGRMAEKRWEALHSVVGMRSSCNAVPGDSWIPKGPFSSTLGPFKFGKISGRVAALAKDFQRNILYAGGASGGLWKSTDDGANWIPIFDSAGSLTIGEVAIDPNHPDTLWVGTGENSMWCEEYFGIGLLRSTDGGGTWERRNGTGDATLQGLSYFCSVLVDPRNSDRLVVGGQWRDCEHGHYYAGGIFTTGDAGLTWTKRLAGYLTRIVRDPVNADVHWAGVGYDGIYRSSDGGDTWVKVSVPGIPVGYDTGRIDIAVAPSNSRVLYALFEMVNGSPEFWRTTDGGASWALMSSGETACEYQCWYNMVLRVHPTDPDLVYKGTVLIGKSSDGGATWHDLSGGLGYAEKVHNDTHAFVLDPSDPNTLYVGCDGGVWKTTDGGETFSNLNGNLCLTQFYDVGTHPDDDGVLIGGTQDNASLARTGSDVWDLQFMTGDGFIGFFDPSDPTTVYCSSYAWPWDDSIQPYIFRRRGDDYSYKWISGTGNGIPMGDRIGWVTPFALDPESPNTLFLGTHRMYKSLDQGTRWAQVGPEDMAGGSDYLTTLDVARAVAQSVKTTGGRFVYAGTSNGRVWRTADGGSAWEEISGGLPATTINDIESDMENPGKAFCVVGGFGTAHLWEYPGSGDWLPIGGGLPDIPANTVLMPFPGILYAGTDVGVFKSADGGRTFLPDQDGMPVGLVITDLEFNANTGTLTAGTFGRGAWQRGINRCSLSCAASVPETGSTGQVVSFSAEATAPGCTGIPSFQWDFGDGSPLSDQQAATHAYSQKGDFPWKLNATQDGSTCVRTGTISITPIPPSVARMSKLAAPFRIAVDGSNFQAGVEVAIDGVTWVGVTRKGGTRLILTGGSTLKAAVPKNTPTEFRFSNPDGGQVTATWQWP